jgi:hypothetical protein
LILDSERKATPTPFNNAKKIIYDHLSVFRLVINAKPIFLKIVNYLKIIGEE